MHAAYNVQICVMNGLITTYLITQSRTDINDFIPLMNRYYEMYNSYPSSICADAGYGTLNNYNYIKEKNIKNFINIKLEKVMYQAKTHQDIKPLMII